MAKHSESEPLGLRDVIAGTLVFVVLCVVLYEVLAVAIPGLLSFAVLKQVIVSGLIFLSFWALLGTFVFQPFFEVLYKREARTKGDLTLAQEKLRESASLEQDLDEQLRLARLEGIKKRDTFLDEAGRAAQEVTDAASKAAREEIESAQKEIEDLKASAETELAEEAEKLAKVVVQRALSSSPEQVIH